MTTFKRQLILRTVPSVTNTTQQENETFPQQNFSPKPVNPLKTILLVLIGVILISSIACVAFWYGRNSQTPVVSEEDAEEATPSTEKAKEELPVATDETAGWKTYVYSDTQNELEFKYPEEWEFKQYEEFGDETGEFWYKSSPVMSFSYVDNPNDLSLEALDQTLKRYSDVEGWSTPGFYSKDNQLVNLLGGVAAYYQKELFCEPSVCQRYIIPHNGKVYTLQIFPRTDLIPNQIKIIDQILSTFKFL